MKNTMLILAFVLASALLLAACAAGETAGVMVNGYRQVSMEEAMRLMEEEEDYILLDVRSLSEYNLRHIPGAICVPNDSLRLSRPPEELPDKDQLILVYCRSGNRSKQASEKLAAMGYTNVVEFGGIIDWPGETVEGAN